MEKGPYAIINEARTRRLTEAEGLSQGERKKEVAWESYSFAFLNEVLKAAGGDEDLAYDALLTFALAHVQSRKAIARLKKDHKDPVLFARVFTNMMIDCGNTSKDPGAYLAIFFSFINSVREAAGQELN